MSKVLLGCDPEIFVLNKASGILESAYGLIKGNKAQPQKVNNGAVQVDGMALEFNIDAAGSEEEWIKNIDSVMSTLASMVPNHILAAIPVADFGYEYIKAQPEEAKELGCDPDYDAWLVAQNPRPNGDNPFRTAAGHIHFGIIDSNDAPTEDMDYIGWIAQKVRELDFYLGLPSLFYDADAKRRELYGKAGAFRPKTYGFEYRTLSNQWLGNDALKRWAYQASQKACEEMDKGVCLNDRYGDIQSIINLSDKQAAAKIIKAEGLLLPAGVSI